MKVEKASPSHFDAQASGWGACVGESRMCAPEEGIWLVPRTSLRGDAPVCGSGWLGLGAREVVACVSRSSRDGGAGTVIEG